MAPVMERVPLARTPTLLDRLGEALDLGGVSCCQWKGHYKRSHWESGAGDVDLLVDPTFAERLDGALDRLGFKLALPPSVGLIPGSANWFGYDTHQRALVHVHVHVQLMLGRFWTTMYRLLRCVRAFAPARRLALGAVMAPPELALAAAAPRAWSFTSPLSVARRSPAADSPTRAPPAARARWQPGGAPGRRWRRQDHVHRRARELARNPVRCPDGAPGQTTALADNVAGWRTPQAAPRAARQRGSRRHARPARAAAPRLHGP